MARITQSEKGEVPELFVTEQVVTAETSIDSSVGKVTIIKPDEGIVFSGVSVKV